NADYLSFVLSKYPFNEIRLFKCFEPHLVAHALVLRITWVTTRFPDRFDHPSGFSDRNVGVGIAVERPDRNFCDTVCPGRLSPATQWDHRGKYIRVHGDDAPRAVATHGLARHIESGRIDAELILQRLDDFDNQLQFGVAP